MMGTIYRYRAVLEKLKSDLILNKKVWSSVLNASDKYYFMGLTNLVIYSFIYF